jgi:hypothetical protein
VEVAARVGFADQSQFTNKFRRLTSMTPKSIANAVLGGFLRYETTTYSRDNSTRDGAGSRCNHRGRRGAEKDRSEWDLQSTPKGRTRDRCSYWRSYGTHEHVSSLNETDRGGRAPLDQ